ncbi:MAG: hypothetical protein PHW66_09605 [Gallionella sp.]|nr:hypothetical protein [Gallionella sp.]
MTLDDMLTYTASELLDDRTELVTGDNDDLWSDSYLVRQFNEAQKILCRRAWVIVEYGSIPAGSITLRTGVSVYPLHKSVLRVYDGTPTTQTAPLGRTEDINLRDTSVVTPYPADAFNAVELGQAASLAGGLATLSGAPLAFASDAASRTLRVFPPPTSTQNGVKVYMKVARLPIKELSLDDMDAEPEVPAEFHLQICEYAAGKALTLPNVDADQKPEGRRLLAAFDQVVKEARQERQRAEASAYRWNFSSTTAVLR